MTKWMIFLPCKLLQHYHLLKSLVSQNRDSWQKLDVFRWSQSILGCSPESGCDTPPAWTNAARQIVVSSLRRVSFDEC